jgi:transposase
MTKRRKFDDNFKGKISLEAIKGEQTISELGSKYEVHPNMIRQWKQQTNENIGSIFSRKQDPRLKENEELIEELYKKLGKKDIELEFLKKKFKNMM